MFIKIHNMLIKGFFFPQADVSRGTSARVGPAVLPPSPPLSCPRTDPAQLGTTAPLAPPRHYPAQQAPSATSPVSDPVSDHRRY